MSTIREFAHRWRAWLGDDRGSSPLELAIVAPGVLLLILGAIQACLIWHANDLALAAAQQGVDAARAYDAAPEAGTARATTFLDQAARDFLGNRQITVTTNGAQVAVTVRAEPLSLLPDRWFTVNQTATGPQEVITTEAGP